jgi:hypothetical protein
LSNDDNNDDDSSSKPKKRTSKTATITNIDSINTDSNVDDSSPKLTKAKKAKTVNIDVDASSSINNDNVSENDNNNNNDNSNDINKKTKKTKKEVVESLDDDDISLFFRMQEAQDAANDDSGVTITLDDKLKKMKKVTMATKATKNSDDTVTDTDTDTDSKPKKVSKKKDVIVTSTSSSSSSVVDKDDSWTTFLDEFGVDDWTTSSDTKSAVIKPKASKRPSKISLDGVTMKEMLTHLVSSIGFEKLFTETDVKAFSVKPTITSSLKVLRAPEMEWARKKIEYLYIQSMKKKL